jgi:hypothetical protein
MQMAGSALGIDLLSVLFLLAGAAGILACWGAWPRTSSTSPLMALFSLVWGCVYLATGVATWRRARVAAPLFVVAIGLIIFPARFLFPGGGALLPSLLVIVPVALVGYRYLDRSHAAAG